MHKTPKSTPICRPSSVSGRRFPKRPEQSSSRWSQPTTIQPDPRRRIPAFSSNSISLSDDASPASIPFGFPNSCRRHHRPTGKLGDENPRSSRGKTHRDPREGICGICCAEPPSTNPTPPTHNKERIPFEWENPQRTIRNSTGFDRFLCASRKSRCTP